MFFADHAVKPLCVREAVVLVEDGKSDNGFFLFLERQIWYGAGRADLTAKVAVIFAVPEARNDHGRKETIKPRLERGRIERIPGTNLHTLPAPHALLQEIVIPANAGGA